MTAPNGTSYLLGVAFAFVMALVGCASAGIHGTQPAVRRVAHNEREIEIDARIDDEGPLLNELVRRGFAVSAIWKVSSDSSLRLALVERPAMGTSYGPQLIGVAVDGEVRVLHESPRLYDDDFVYPTFFMFADRTLLLADHGSEDAYGVLAWSIENGRIRDLGELPIALPEGRDVFTRGAAPTACVKVRKGKYVITIPGPVLLNPRGEDERVLAQKGETVVFHEVAGTFELARP